MNIESKKSRKRKIDTEDNRKVKIPKKENMWSPLGSGTIDYDTPIIIDNEWVSATRIKNYLLNDPLIDWLDLYYDKSALGSCPRDDKSALGSCPRDKKNKPNNNMNSKKNTKIPLNMQVLCDNGNKFESLVIEEIAKNHQNNFVKISNSLEDNTWENFLRTVDCINKKVPIICQAVLYNTINKTFGTADLLIKCNYMNKVFTNATDEDDDYYRVIDIKWSTLPLCSDGKLIRNSARYPAYKGQLAIYNCALGNIQGFTPNTAYIIGHSSKFQKIKEKVVCYSTFSSVGQIDYSDFDKQYISRSAEGVEWIRRVRREGATWTLNPPSVPELYPNMSNQHDLQWVSVKSKLAEEIKELSLLWMVGPKNREIGHDNNIYKWTDKKCSAKKLGINGPKTAPILDKIIEINNSDNLIMFPDKIKNNMLNWQKCNHNDFFIDFETLNKCFVDNINLENSKTDSNFIFLIGLGYLAHNNKHTNCEWKFKYFKIDNLQKESEKKIIIELIEFVNSISEKPRFIHWSPAENTIINAANARHDNIWSTWLSNIEWIDLCKIFQTEPIIIKGSLKFKLKDVAKAMYKHRMIKTTWDENLGDGLTVMINAIKHFKDDLLADSKKGQKRNNLNEIINYNEIDCRVMWEIMEYLRKKVEIINE